MAICMPNNFHSVVHHPSVKFRNLGYALGRAVTPYIIPSRVFRQVKYGPMYNMTVSTNDSNSSDEVEPLLKEDWDELMYCYGCGAPLKWGDDKCPSCGTYQ